MDDFYLKNRTFASTGEGVGSRKNEVAEAVVAASSA